MGKEKEMCGEEGAASVMRFEVQISSDPTRAACAVEARLKHFFVNIYSHFCINIHYVFINKINTNITFCFDRGEVLVSL